ncbi:hypothetical protein J6590_014112 [Homalodisca vitripennis]|nr:hypothetical protein J6590_014112 [Homalodisca vitripennis]
MPPPLQNFWKCCWLLLPIPTGIFHWPFTCLQTILAHCVHLQDSEMEMIKDARCSIAHCPSSNINLRSGVCNVRRLLDKGINVCLGTDVAGGNSSSILDEMRAALNTSITLSFQHEDYIPLSYHEVFYMATMGGAIVRRLIVSGLGHYMGSML